MITSPRIPGGGLHGEARLSHRISVVENRKLGAGVQMGVELRAHFAVFSAAAGGQAAGHAHRGSAVAARRPAPPSAALFSCSCSGCAGLGVPFEIEEPLPCTIRIMDVLRRGVR